MISTIEYYQFKVLLSQISGIVMDTLHVLAGLGLQFVVAFLLRTPLSRWKPWLAVLVVALANEWSDLRVERWPDLGAQYGGAAKDIVLTLLLPSLILLICRFKPRLLVDQPVDQ